MADYPTLSVGPEEPYKETYEAGGDLKSDAEAGYVITRQRYTRRRLSFEFMYEALTDADYVLMDAFIADQGTTGNFNFTHPVTSTVYDVRFAEIPVLARRGLVWHTTVKLIEV